MDVLLCRVWKQLSWKAVQLYTKRYSQSGILIISCRILWDRLCNYHYITVPRTRSSAERSRTTSHRESLPSWDSSQVRSVDPRMQEATAIAKTAVTLLEEFAQSTRRAPHLGSSAPPARSLPSVHCSGPIVERRALMVHHLSRLHRTPVATDFLVGDQSQHRHRAVGSGARWQECWAEVSRHR